MEKVLWFDMDGTMADLYAVEGWLEKLRSDDASPYAEARPMFNFSLFARYLNKLQAEGWELGIISWGSKLASDEYLGRIEVAKRSWLHQHLTSVSWNYIHVVEYGRDKWEVCGGGILFDDEEKNRDSWEDDAYSPDEIFTILKSLLSA